MSDRKIYLSICGLVVAVVLGGVFLLWSGAYQKTTDVIFLNVGEGDAILISQGSNQVLIDGGRYGKELLTRLGRHLPFWDRTIETVIATHPDADHIGGFPSLLSAYTVRAFLSTGLESETETAEMLRRALVSREVATHTLFRGGSVRLPNGGELSIEYPLTALSEDMKESNAGSIVARFTYGETVILLTGDLPEEEKVLPDTQPAEILKVAHHGSKYSTSAAFLDMVWPKEAIISVGKNSYGHPSPDVLERLKMLGIIVRRTDMDGDIRYRCTEESARCVFSP